MYIRKIIPMKKNIKRFEEVIGDSVRKIIRKKLQRPHIHCVHT